MEKAKVGGCYLVHISTSVKTRKTHNYKNNRNLVYCDKTRFDKEDYLLHSSLNDATQAVNFRLKAHIEKIQHQIDENLKQLEQENGK